MCALSDSAAQSAAILPPGVPPRQVGRPWAKDLSLYEEYKMRRSELRRRNMTKRRELEKSLPQPLLADLVSPPQIVEDLRFLHIYVKKVPHL